MKEILFTDKAPAPIGPYSQGVKASGTLFFFSGQIALDPNGVFQSGTIEQETELVCKNIETLLSAQGLTFDNVVKSLVFLKDMGEFSAMNTVYSTYFGSSVPARSTVQVAELPKSARVEIEVIAVG